MTSSTSADAQGTHRRAQSGVRQHQAAHQRVQRRAQGDRQRQSLPCAREQAAQIQ